MIPTRKRLCPCHADMRRAWTFVYLVPPIKAFAICALFGLRSSAHSGNYRRLTPFCDTFVERQPGKTFLHWPNWVQRYLASAQLPSTRLLSVQSKRRIWTTLGLGTWKSCPMLPQASMGEPSEGYAVRLETYTTSCISYVCIYIYIYV